MRRQLKVTFMTMTKGAERMDEEGQEDGLDLKEGGQREEMHHSNFAGFIKPKRRSFR